MNNLFQECKMFEKIVSTVPKLEGNDDEKYSQYVQHSNILNVLFTLHPKSFSILTNYR